MARVSNALRIIQDALTAAYEGGAVLPVDASFLARAITDVKVAPETIELALRKFLCAKLEENSQVSPSSSLFVLCL